MARTKAKIMSRADGSIWINSFAHGRAVYDVKWDSVALEAAINACDPDTGRRSVRGIAVLNAEIAQDEEQRLRAIAGRN